jgi:toxin ParE1/3/4
LKVQFTPSARRQFLAVIAYIRRDKPSAAVRFRKRCESVLTRLEEYPDSGRKIPEFPELPYLEVVIGNYRFFYRVESDVVWIVAVWHGAQLPSDPAGHA